MDGNLSGNNLTTFIAINNQIYNIYKENHCYLNSYVGCKNPKYS